LVADALTFGTAKTPVTKARYPERGRVNRHGADDPRERWNPEEFDRKIVVGLQGYLRLRHKSPRP
jgi:hypothetical protein